MKIAITGQNGFIGSHLYRKAICSGKFQCVEFPRQLFQQPEQMKELLADCDAVIHLAGLSRHEDGEHLFEVNTELTRRLAECCSGHQKIYLASTTHEQKQLPYHASKRECRRILEQYGNYGILLMANTFGPGSRPFYNSVVSTFCMLAAEHRAPEEINDVKLQLIGVHDLCVKILEAVQQGRSGEIRIDHTFEIALPELWRKLQNWIAEPCPHFADRSEIQLYETLMSYH